MPSPMRKTASDCGQTSKRSLSRRGRSICGKDSGKVLAIVEEQRKPEHRHNQRAPDAFVITQQMVEQNIYDYRPKNRHRQRNIAIDQQHRAANRLHCADRQPKVRLEYGLTKLSAEAAADTALE